MRGGGGGAGCENPWLFEGGIPVAKIKVLKFGRCHRGTVVK